MESKKKNISTQSIKVSLLTKCVALCFLIQLGRFADWRFLYGIHVCSNVWGDQ